MMKKIFAVLLTIAIILVIAYQLGVPHILIGKYLSPSDVLTKADAIVVVSGDNDRMKHAIDLYKQGFAPKLIISGSARGGDVSNALAMHIEASNSGIPDDAVILEEKATNTFENAIFTKNIVQSKGFKNMILVSSPYHQRRVYETFRNVFKGADVTFQNSPSIYSSWKVDSWWKINKDAHLTQEEIAKILWAKISGNYR